jgi:hypothetical protein
MAVECEIHIYTYICIYIFVCIALDYYKKRLSMTRDARRECQASLQTDSIEWEFFSLISAFYTAYMAWIVFSLVNVEICFACNFKYFTMNVSLTCESCGVLPVSSGNVREQHHEECITQL